MVAFQLVFTIFDSPTFNEIVLFSINVSSQYISTKVVPSFLPRLVMFAFIPTRLPSKGSGGWNDTLTVKSGTPTNTIWPRLLFVSFDSLILLSESAVIFNV